MKMQIKQLEMEKRKMERLNDTLKKKLHAVRRKGRRERGASSVHMVHITLQYLPCLISITLFAPIRLRHVELGSGRKIAVRRVALDQRGRQVRGTISTLPAASLISLSYSFQSCSLKDSEGRRTPWTVGARR